MEVIDIRKMEKSMTMDILDRLFLLANVSTTIQYIAIHSSSLRKNPSTLKITDTLNIADKAPDSIKTHIGLFSMLTRGLIISLSSIAQV